MDSDTGPGGRVYRIMWLQSALLEESYPNAESAAEQLGVQPRTVRSDIGYLRQSLNHQIGFDRNRNGWYYTERPLPLPILSLTGDAVDVLRRAFTVAASYLTPTESHTLKGLIDRWTLVHPAVRPSDLETAAGATPRFHPIDPALRLDIDRALTDRTRMEIAYYSPNSDSESQRVIRPYHIRNYQGEIYLVAYCEMRDALRTFHTGRIRRAKLLPEVGAYSIPPDFDADAYFQAALALESGNEAQIVTVRVDAYQARWFSERRIHPSETRVPLPDGSLRVTLCVALSAELKRWILMYGHHIVVESPDELRAAIVTELDAAQKNYK